MRLQIEAKTDVGIVRDHNEDNYLVNPDLGTDEWFFESDERYSPSPQGTLLVVADGMGGMNAGEIASKIAIETTKKYFWELGDIPEQEIAVVMKRVFIIANNEMVRHSREHPKTKGMGTTLTIAWIRDSVAHVAWIGDSRAYLMRKGKKIRQITKDHSLVQQWIDEGRLDEEGAFYHPKNNIVTRSLGDSSTPPEPDYTSCPLTTDDRVLLCSDGLNGMLLDREIQEIMNFRPDDLKFTTEELIKEALKAGGKDNVTLILAYMRKASGAVIPEYINPEVLEPAAATAATIPIGEKSKSLTKDQKKNRWLIIASALIFTLAIYIGLDLWNDTNNNSKLKEDLQQQKMKVDSLRRDSIRRDSIAKAKLERANGVGNNTTQVHVSNNNRISSNQQRQSSGNSAGTRAPEGNPPQNEQSGQKPPEIPDNLKFTKDSSKSDLNIVSGSKDDQLNEVVLSGPKNPGANSNNEEPVQSESKNKIKVADLFPCKSKEKVFNNKIGFKTKKDCEEQNDNWAIPPTFSKASELNAQGVATVVFADSKRRANIMIIPTPDGSIPFKYRVVGDSD